VNRAPALRRDPLYDDLYAHQAAELEYLLATTGHRLLHGQMGCGKTQPIARLGWALNGAKLYLCPASCKRQTARELRRWGKPGTTIQVVEGRSARLDGSEWTVINHDLLLSDPLFAQLIARRYMLLASDENHMLRNAAAKRTQRVYGRAPCLADQADRVVAMTGTPIISSPADLFPTLNRLFPRAIATQDAAGTLRRTQWAEFTERYCTFRDIHIAGGRTVRRPSGGQNLAELRVKLAPFMSRLRREHVLDLPPLQLTEYALTISVTDAAAIDEAERELPPALRERLQRATADELADLLRQYSPHLSTLRRILGMVKAAPAAEHIAERLAGGEDRVAVFFHHHGTADLLLEHLSLNGIIAGMIRGDTPLAARDRAITEFTAGRLQALLLQLQSGSLGLNLQCARRAVFVETDWTAAANEQAIARLHRANQARSVVVEFLLVPDTLDEHIVSTAQRKAAVAAALIEQAEPTP
jgi:SWI/SNF-related matrix-associated actin-dependent regulator 1 of chromatin subfamily A